MVQPRISKLERHVQRLLEKDERVIPTDIQEEAVERVNELEELRAQLRRPAAFRKFLQSYVQEQRQAYREADRGEPLCRCSHSACEVKRGIIPGVIRHAESLHDGIDEYQARHPQAAIFVEARERWGEMRAEYRSELRETKLLLRKGLQQTAGAAAEAD